MGVTVIQGVLVTFSSLQRGVPLSLCRAFYGGKEGGAFFAGQEVYNLTGLAGYKCVCDYGTDAVTLSTQGTFYQPGK